MLRLTLVLLSLLALRQPELIGADSVTQVTITNAADIHHLSREAANLGFPVMLTGAVTYSDRLWNVLFVCDASSGVFVFLSDGEYPTNGELVEIVGRTGDGSFLPVVTAATWRHMGVGTLPQPRRISQPERFAAEIDSQWSEFVGVVREVSMNSEKNHFQIDLADAGWRARAFVPASAVRDPVALNRMIDARVRIVGVAGIDYDESAPGGVRLKAFVPDGGRIQALDQPTGDPFALPFVPLAKAPGNSATNVHRIHVRGLVTYVGSSGELVLQQENSALRVLGNTQGFKVGDSLEAVGFVAPGIFSPVLEDAAVRPTSEPAKAPPVSVVPASVLWGNYDGRLVRLTGILQSRETVETKQVLKLLGDGVLFVAALEGTPAPGDWSRLKNGDRVQVTGVCTVQGAKRASPQSFQVLLRSAADAVCMPRELEFSARQVLTLIALGAAACGLVLLWGMVLKRRVAEQTAELANSLSLLQATIESTADGILVVDHCGKVTHYNRNFAQMWRLPSEVMDSKDDRHLVEFVVSQLIDEAAFLNKVKEVYATDLESLDTLEFKDGRVFERYSQPQRLGARCVGRVWSFRDVTARKRAEVESEVLNRKLLETSRQVGMAEVATAVLHNVGNVLNSVNVSATIVKDRLQRSRANNLVQAAELIELRMNDLETFLRQDPKGQKLRQYLKQLGVTLVHENDEIRTELELLRRNIEHIKAIVAMQQSYARVGGTLEKLDPKELMENAVQINGAAFERDQIQVRREYQPVPQFLVERHKVLQILINLLSNARHALESSPRANRQVTLSIFPKGAERVCLQVSDNGSGIESQNLGRIFNQGFTTRQDGHGFGLHSGANAAKEMNGALCVRSDGPGQGASFTLELPLAKGA